MKVLSAGAVQPGLIKVLEAFRAVNDGDVRIDFATAPAIVKRIAAGELVDMVVMPTDLLDVLTTTAQVLSNRISLGSIGVGVMVRGGAKLPKLSDVLEFKQSLSIADRIIYNQASTGIYLDTLFQRLGVAAALQTKTIRYPDFAAVRSHIANGYGNEIGLGATTVIIENIGNGVTFVGPLPVEIQNYTSYAAALTSSAGNGAAAFFDYLATPTARSILTSAGIG
jgi:molybdate transport system substrate-binding protein